MPEKLFIKNRKGQKVAVLVEQPPQASLAKGGLSPRRSDLGHAGGPTHPKGLAFVMHGLGGFKEQPHIQAFAEAFLENSFTVVRFDTTNTPGESDGMYEDATTTNYYEDLEDVIAWAAAGEPRQRRATTQPWYQEPFFLAGHSLGGICIALYAEQHPEKVKALAPISTVVSGKLSMEIKTDRGDNIDAWRRTGWLVTQSASKPGTTKRLKWSHMEDRLKYDLLPMAHKLAMPVLLMVGEYDDSTPLKSQQLLYDALPGKKELHVIKCAEHTFREPVHLAEIKNIFDRWIKTYS